MNKEYILIFKPKLARNLLRNGFNIVDIKADKNNPDRTIFVFERTKELLEMIPHPLGEDGVVETYSSIFDA